MAVRRRTGNPIAAYVAVIGAVEVTGRFSSRENT